MLSRLVRTWRSIISAMILGFMFLSISGTGASALQEHHLRAAPVLDITITPEGFVVPDPNPRPGGPVTFRVTAEGAYGYWWSAYKLRGDTTLDQFVEWLGQAASPDPAVSLPAIRQLYANIDYSGGAKVYPGNPIEITQDLTPGTYYFGSLAIPGPQVDGAAAPDAVTMLAGPRSTFGVLEVTDERRPAVPPRIDSVIYMTEHGDRNVMLTTPSLPADGSFLVRNDSSQPQEAVFVELAPGATERDIQAYYDAQLDGRPLPPRPFLDSVGGLLALSEGKQVILGIDLPPGRYAIMSFLRNAETGRDSAATGMYRIVTLR